MYQKKVLFEHTRFSTGEPIPFVAAGSKFTDGPAVTRSAYKGKQATTAPPKRIAAAQEGVFSKMTYASDPFDDTTGTLKEEPLDKRKLGFYSKAPSGRGAFSRTVDVERYREAMAHEYKAIDRMAASAAAAAETMLPPVSPIVARTGTRVLASIEREAPDVRAGMPKHLYDFIHTDATRPDWQRTARDMWYSAQLLPAKERRRVGPFEITSDAYGVGVEGAAKAPEHGKVSAWKDFLDKGHREANMSRF